MDDSSAGTSLGLLAGTRAGEHEAWRRLVALYTPLVGHWCRQWQVRDDDVGDLVQEVFGAVATHLPRFHRDRPGDSFRGWLRTIAHNKVRDHFRRRGREPPCDPDFSLSGIAADPPQDPALRRLVHRALDLIRDEFGPQTWRAFWRTAVEGAGAPEAAAELGMSAGAVRVAKSRVLQRLREQLGEVEDPKL